MQYALGVCTKQIPQESLPWALRPSALKGCVGTLKDGYLHKAPSPQVPRGQSIIPVACTVTFPANPHYTNYLQDPWIPLHNNLTILLLDSSKLHLHFCLAGQYRLAINSIEQPFVYC